MAKKLKKTAFSNGAKGARGKIQKKANANKLRSVALVLLAAVAALVTSCTPPDETRTETMQLKGEEIKNFDMDAAKRFLSNKDVTKLLILSDGQFQGANESDMAWLAEKFMGLDKIAPGLIDGNKTLLNPTLTPDVGSEWTADSTFLAGTLNYDVRPTRTEDPCGPIIAEYDSLTTSFTVDRDSCLTYFLPQCMEIDGYKELYDHFTATDPLLRPQKVIGRIGNNMENLPEPQQIVIKGAARTGNRAFDKQEIVDKFYENNIICFM